MRRGERSALIFAVLAGVLAAAMIVFWPVDRAQILESIAPATGADADAGGAALATELGAGRRPASGPSNPTFQEARSTIQW